MKRPKLIGLTGNIGSGKSTVANLFVDKGAALIDSDVLAREATKDPKVLKSIAETLGESLIVDGALDRAKTADLVFNNKDALETLNSIIHPWVRSESNRRIDLLTNQLDPPPIILLDIPLLYENGLEEGLDAVIVVDAPLETRTQRVMERSKLNRREVHARDSAQMPLKDKVARADYTIDNKGDLESLKEQVAKLYQALSEHP